jgi:hypothetical protein
VVKEEKVEAAVEKMAENSVVTMNKTQEIQQPSEAEQSGP